MSRIPGPTYQPGSQEIRRHLTDQQRQIDKMKAYNAQYVPLWQTSAGTQIELANGVLLGNYGRVGPLCIASIFLKVGSDTQLGDPTALDLTYWVFTLPFKAAFLTTGAAELRDYGNVSRVGISKTAWEPGREQSVIVVPEQSGLPVGSDSPFTWGEGDELRLSLCYIVGG